MAPRVITVEHKVKQTHLYISTSFVLSFLQLWFQTSYISSNLWLSKYSFTSANDSGGANITSRRFAVSREVFLLGYGAFGVAQGKQLSLFFIVCMRYRSYCRNMYI